MSDLILLETERLKKSYKIGKKEVLALNEVSLQVRAAEFLAVVGPSGAGKSTLLHLLGGLDLPSYGKVTLGGCDLYAASEAERARIRNQNIGFIFQFYHLLPELNVWENVTLPLLIGRQGVNSTLKQEAMELIEAVKLKHRLKHRPNELSGGEQQRAAIVRALVNRPKLVLCDEPTGNLDSQMGRDIINLLKALNQKRGCTFIVASHDPEVTKFSTRVIRIKDGSLLN